MKIGIIGFGNMGSVMAQNLRDYHEVFVFDKDKTKIQGLKGIAAVDNIKKLINFVDVVVLAIKPQDFENVLKGLKGLAQDKLIISIAAGVSTAHIEQVLGKIRVIRAMPNLGIKVGESVTCICKGKFSSFEDLEFAIEDFFCYFGVVKEIDEKMMNAATAISGSGPAYIFDFLEANQTDPKNIPEHTKQDLIKRLERAAESVNFSHDDAMFLAASTATGALALAKIYPPGDLKKQVTSKGGTTEAALKVLAAGGNWDEAAKAALKRAEELCKI
ncbi:MAG: pyrroline-5-carboxylate reductase [Candidatus Omnitrophica bacterium]|nr:pyrroline-5-carboxylate reductase [Candidatus Omnitrophota bacterium]